MREYSKRLYRRVAGYQLEAIGVIEIILILVIIIGLILIFRNQIEEIIKVAFESITGDATEIGADFDIN